MTVDEARHFWQQVDRLQESHPELAAEIRYRIVTVFSHAMRTGLLDLSRLDSCEDRKLKLTIQKLFVPLLKGERP